MFQPYLELPRTVYLLCLGTFINRAGTFLVPFLTLYLHKHLHLPKTFATTAMGVFGLGCVCGALTGGVLADRFGRRPVMLLSFFGAAGLMLTLSTIDNGGLFLALLFVFAVMGDLYRPAVMAMVADVVPPLQRAYAYGLLFMSVNLGFAIGPVVGGALSEYSFKLLFYGDALTTAMYATIILLMIPETMPGLLAGRTPSGEQPRSTGRPNRLAGDNDGQGQASCAVAVRIGGDRRSGAGGQIPLAAVARHIATNYVFLAFCGGMLLLALVFMQSMSTLPIYLESLPTPIPPWQYGIIIAINGWMIVLLQIPATAWAVRQNRGALLVTTAVLVAVGFGMKGWAQTWPMFALAVAIWTLGEIINHPLSSPIVADLAPIEMRARYMGVFSMCFSGANMIGAPLGGLVLTTLGGWWLWMLSAGLALLAGAVFLAIAPRVAARDGAAGGEPDQSRVSP